MIQQQRPSSRAQTLFRVLAIATLVSAFAQVTLGGIVRVTGSGLGCPDWPLCHGSIVPPFVLETWIEWTHRLSGTLLGVLVIGTCAVALYSYRSNKWIVYASITALVMVVAAGLLGGATVLTELEWWVRLVHLAIAEIVVAAMAFALVAGFRLGRKRPRVERHLQTDRRLNYLVIASIIGVFLVILSGSFMVGYGAGTSCATWPLCRGELLPQGPPFAVHMGHRLLAAVVGLVVIATVVAAMRKRSERPGVARVGHYVGIAFVLQIVLGAALVWSVFSPEMKSLHLSAATLVWLTVVLLAAVLFTPPYFEAEQEARRPMKTVSGLKRITS